MINPIVNIKYDKMLNMVPKEQANIAFCMLDKALDLWKEGRLRGQNFQAFLSNGNEIRGYIIVNQSVKTIFVCFLGSHSLRDWYYDSKCQKMASPFLLVRGRIHSGFFQIYQDSLTRLNTVFNRVFLEYPNYSVVLTGHSLGAVLAIFYSITLMKLGMLFPVVIFCSPKFGDEEFNIGYLKLLQFYRVAFYKTRNEYDMITRLPPSIFGYDSLYNYRTSPNDHKYKNFNFRVHGIKRFNHTFQLKTENKDVSQERKL